MNLKKTLQERIHNKNVEKYERDVELQKNSYASFLERTEKNSIHSMQRVMKKPKVMDGVLVIPFSVCKNSDFLIGCDTDYLLFVGDDGWIEDTSIKIIKERFEETSADIIYSNEDVITSDHLRCKPWMKPEWSPDTFLSYFYFGNIVAIRKACVDQLTWPKENSGLACLYAFLLELTKEKKAVQIDDILYHSAQDTQMPGGEEEYIPIKSKWMEQQGIHADFEKNADGCMYPIYGNISEKVSILIPSKDHPDVLERCVKSIRAISTYSNYEIIVIDNGSKEENQNKYRLLEQQYHFRYLYHPMEFNFSMMCNLAAKEAAGEYYLFLNDDVEILIPNWLERMLGTARQPHVGAVGAKLLFPESHLIQHVGITNMYEGPAHKLLQMSDEICYDHGRNRGVRDVIGVTAACLMIDKTKFLSMQGFTEDLAVAYNDVDLNFRLHRIGLYNVIRNDVVLYHYESLSRGDDRADEAKRLRLRKEWEMLYTRNPDYYDFDPFYSKGLTGVSERYECSLPYENCNLLPCNELKKVRKQPKRQSINETLIIHVDHAELERFAKKGKEKCYLIDLHAHVRGLDSSDYTYRMFLKGNEECYEIPVIRRYRPDAIKTHHEQIHVELSGFAVRIPEGILPHGTYEIWMEAKCIYSRQVLLNCAERQLEV